jgi:hypothetical protein
MSRNSSIVFGRPEPCETSEEVSGLHRRLFGSAGIIPYPVSDFAVLSRFYASPLELRGTRAYALNKRPTLCRSGRA